MIATFSLKPTRVGTEMAYTVDYEMPWSILGNILDKLFVRRALEKDITGEAEKLKSFLEK